MSDKSAHPRKALIAAVFGDGSSLVFQRRFLKACREQPQLEREQVLVRLLASADVREGDQRLHRLREMRIKVTTLLDTNYPLMLKEIPDPPLVLFYSGQIQALHRPCISIVGARSSTTYGLQTAKKIAGELARLGFVIVSGLALGVDGQAHAAALEVQGRTVAVLGSGIDQIYPREHRDLAASMVRQGGAAVSEFLPGTSPKAFHFPIRNRVISGLSHATIVVEAKEKSGSLITARHCLDQGRELFAVPGPIHYATSGGTNRLIDRGEARLFRSVESVLEELRPLLGLAASHQAHLAAEIEDPVAKKIYERLDAFEAVPLDLLVAELGLDASVVIAKLVDLETSNLVERKPGQLFVRNPLAASG